MIRDNGQKSYALAMLVVAVLMGPRKGASVGSAFDLPRENLYACKLWPSSLYPCFNPPAAAFVITHTTKLSKRLGHIRASLPSTMATRTGPSFDIRTL